MRSFGYLKYDPKHPSTTFEPWWLMLQCDAELVDYYRYWISKEYSHPVPSKLWIQKAKIPKVKGFWNFFQKGVKIDKSVWGPHISIVRGEVPTKPELWGKWPGRKVWFDYDPESLNNNGKHWWVTVKSEELELLRLELGLTPQFTFFHRNSGQTRVRQFHLTIGHMLK